MFYDFYFFRSSSKAKTMSFLSEDPAFQKLKSLHDQQGKNFNLLAAFKEDPLRFEKYQ